MVTFFSSFEKGVRWISRSSFMAKALLVWTSPASFEQDMYHPQHDIQTRSIDAPNDTTSQQHDIQCFGKGYKDTKIISRFFYQKCKIMLILMFCFGCCCSPSSPLSVFSIVCILACALLDSNALAGTLCCSTAPCGSPCILEMYVHWVVVCCTTNNKRREEEKMLLL